MLNATNNCQIAFIKAVPNLKLSSTSLTLVLLSKVHVRTRPHTGLVPRAINQSGPHLGLKGVLCEKASPSVQCSNGSLGGSFYLRTALLYGAQLFDLKIPPLMRSLPRTIRLTELVWRNCKFSTNRSFSTAYWEPSLKFKQDYHVTETQRLKVLTFNSVTRLIFFFLWQRWLILTENEIVWSSNTR